MLIEQRPGDQAREGLAGLSAKDVKTEQAIHSLDLPHFAVPIMLMLILCTLDSSISNPEYLYSDRIYKPHSHIHVKPDQLVQTN